MFISTPFFGGAVHVFHQIVWYIMAIVLSIGLIAFSGAFIMLALEGFKQSFGTIGGSMGRIPSLLITKRW